MRQRDGGHQCDGPDHERVVALADMPRAALSSGTMTEASRTDSTTGPRPYPLLGVLLSLVLAAVVLAALLTAIVYLGATLEFSSRAAALAETRRAAGMLFIALPGYAVTFGLAAILILDRWFGWRRPLAFAAGGALAGVLGAALQAAMVPMPGGSGPGAYIAAAGISAALLLLARVLLSLMRRVMGWW